MFRRFRPRISHSQIQARQDSAADPRSGRPLTSHVKQLVVAAYQLDNFGDLGNAQKIRMPIATFQRP